MDNQYIQRLIDMLEKTNQKIAELDTISDPEERAAKKVMFSESKKDLEKRIADAKTENGAVEQIGITESSAPVSTSKKASSSKSKASKEKATKAKKKTEKTKSTTKKKTFEKKPAKKVEKSKPVEKKSATKKSSAKKQTKKIETPKKADKVSAVAKTKSKKDSKSASKKTTNLTKDMVDAKTAFENESKVEKRAIKKSAKKADKNYKETVKKDSKSLKKENSKTKSYRNNDLKVKPGTDAEQLEAKLKGASGKDKQLEEATAVFSANKKSKPATTKKASKKKPAKKVERSKPAANKIATKSKPATKKVTKTSTTTKSKPVAKKSVVVKPTNDIDSFLKAGITEQQEPVKIKAKIKLENSSHIVQNQIEENAKKTPKAVQSTANKKAIKSKPKGKVETVVINDITIPVVSDAYNELRRTKDFAEFGTEHYAYSKKDLKNNTSISNVLAYFPSTELVINEYEVKPYKEDVIIRNYRDDSDKTNTIEKIKESSSISQPLTRKEKAEAKREAKLAKKLAKKQAKENKISNAKKKENKIVSKPKDEPKISKQEKSKDTKESSPISQPKKEVSKEIPKQMKFDLTFETVNGINVPIFNDSFEELRKTKDFAEFGTEHYSYTKKDLKENTKVSNALYWEPKIAVVIQKHNVEQYKEATIVGAYRDSQDQTNVIEKIKESSSISQPLTRKEKAEAKRKAKLAKKQAKKDSKKVEKETLEMDKKTKTAVSKGETTNNKNLINEAEIDLSNAKNEVSFENEDSTKNEDKAIQQQKVELAKKEEAESKVISKEQEKTAKELEDAQKELQQAMKEVEAAKLEAETIKQKALEEQQKAVNDKTVSKLAKKQAKLAAKQEKQRQAAEQAAKREEHEKMLRESKANAHKKAEEVSNASSIDEKVIDEKANEEATKSVKEAKKDFEKAEESKAQKQANAKEFNEDKKADKAVTSTESKHEERVDARAAKRADIEKGKFIEVQATPIKDEGVKSLKAINKRQKQWTSKYSKDILEGAIVTTTNYKPDVKKHVIELHDVTKSYLTGDVETKVLKGIDIKLNKSDFIVILGPSGSGKTTFLNTISGLDKATKGDVFALGYNLSLLKDSHLTKFRRKHVGFIFQQYNLLTNLTAKENAEVGENLSTHKNEDMTIEDIFETIGMKEQMNKYPHQMSGGQQQRVSIARALAKNPDILFADEPTGALDEVMGRKVLEILVEVNQRYGTTVIVVTHNPNIAKIGNTVIHIKNGLIDEVEVNPTPADPATIEWS